MKFIFLISLRSKKPAYTPLFIAKRLKKTLCFRGKAPLKIRQNQLAIGANLEFHGRATIIIVR